MRGRRKRTRAFGTLLLLGGLLLANGLPNGWARDSAPNSHEWQTYDGPSRSVGEFMQKVSQPAPLATPTKWPAPPKRLLVIAPHPDDASLAAATMIARTLASGGTVRLVVMTNGDGFHKAATKIFGVEHPQPHDMYRLGVVRQQEELRAACELGLLKQDVQFLGYPDGGLQQLWSTRHWTSRTPFRGLNGYAHVPYELSLHRVAPYCGQAVVADLKQVMNEFHPTDVLFPDPHDIHHDHWSTSAFTQYALAQLQQQKQQHSPKQPQRWTYLIHYPHFPVPRAYQPQQTLQPPSNLAVTGVHWLQWPLNHALLAAKERAVRSHRTQLNVMSDLLLAFLRPNELFGVYVQPKLQEASAAEHLFAQHGKEMPYTVIRDPLQDQETHFAHIAAGDIRAVAAVRTGSHVQIAVEMAGEIQPALDYWLHVRLPDVATASAQPLEFHIREGRLLLSHTQTPNTAHPTTVQFTSHRLILTLPAASLHGAHTMLLNAEVKLHQHLIDQTAWQTLQMTQTPFP